jgi:hypothetical protein
MVATTLDDSFDIPKGTGVYTADGQHLGDVMEGDAYELVVERGFFRIHVYEIALSDVDRFEDGKLILSVTLRQVEARVATG